MKCRQSYSVDVYVKIEIDHSFKIRTKRFPKSTKMTKKRTATSKHFDSKKSYD